LGYAIIDIESTGGKIDEEAIIDIAILRFDGHRLTDQFHSLVNPERPIQPFVTSLTGISEKMVRNAPKFYEIAKRILEITENTVLVAHNTQFDYRILKEEFGRLGYPFKASTLCTVEFSKRILTDQSSFKLDKLAKNLGIPISDRHRALGDAEATLSLLKVLREKDVIGFNEKELLRSKDESDTLPSHLEIVRNAPAKPAVFKLYGKKEKLIYCGYTPTLKSTISTLLSADTYTHKPLFKSVKQLDFEECPSALMGLVKVYHHQKLMRPLLRYNIEAYAAPESIKSFSGLILDKGRTEGESAILQLKNGVLVAYGYTDLNHQITREEILKNRLTEVTKDLFYSSVIAFHLTQQKYKTLEL
jgi:DNA polymerase III subunit epsilon